MSIYASILLTITFLTLTSAYDKHGLQTRKFIDSLM